MRHFIGPNGTVEHEFKVNKQILVKWHPLTTIHSFEEEKTATIDFVKRQKLRRSNSQRVEQDSIAGDDPDVFLTLSDDEEKYDELCNFSENFKSPMS